MWRALSWAKWHRYAIGTHMHLPILMALSSGLSRDLPFWIGLVNPLTYPSLVWTNKISHTFQRDIVSKAKQSKASNEERTQKSNGKRSGHGSRVNITGRAFHQMCLIGPYSLGIRDILASVLSSWDGNSIIDVLLNAPHLTVDLS